MLPNMSQLLYINNERLTARKALDSQWIVFNEGNTQRISKPNIGFTVVAERQLDVDNPNHAVTHERDSNRGYLSKRQRSNQLHYSLHRLTRLSTIFVRAVRTKIILNV